MDQYPLKLTNLLVNASNSDNIASSNTANPDMSSGVIGVSSMPTIVVDNGSSSTLDSTGMKLLKLVPAVKSETESGEGGDDQIQSWQFPLVNNQQTVTLGLESGDKRAHHNALERKRRDHIKDCFQILRDAIPSITGEKCSRSVILMRATEYIKQVRMKNAQNLQTIESLKKENDDLEVELESLDDRAASVQSSRPVTTATPGTRSTVSLLRKSTTPAASAPPTNTTTPSLSSTVATITPVLSGRTKPGLSSTLQAPVTLDLRSIRSHQSNNSSADGETEPKQMKLM